jgi:two-component system chemotaxis response regulator CheY
MLEPTQLYEECFSLEGDLALDYLAESGEHLTAVELDLLAMDKEGANLNEERVNRIFRAVHSVKGGAGFFNLLKIRELAHKTEDVLALIRSHEVPSSSDRTRVLLKATDVLKELIQNASRSNRVDISGIIAALTRLSARKEEHPPSRRLRILVAEDDFVSRMVLQTFLSRYGECHVAVNGLEVVEAFRLALDRKQSYDLICMDIMMPEMDGREAVRRIRTLEESKGILSTAGAKIIMTTAVHDIKEVIRCFQELCDAYLMKPIDMTKLLSHMKSFHLME